MKVIYADNWKERMERCEKINCDNKKRRDLLKAIFLLGLCSLLFYWWTSVNLLEKNVVIIACAVFTGVLGSYIIWTYISDFVADLFDAIILTRGGRHPMFKQIADTGATLSYLIAEKGAEVKYENGCVSIEYKEEIKKKTETIVIKLENLKTTKNFSLEEPVLDLQKIELITPQKN